MTTDCAGEKPKNKVAESKEDTNTFLEKNLPKYSKPERIFYVSDRGCGKCNKLFLKLIEEIHQRGNSKDYFLIGASKLRLDISYFIENGERVRLLERKKHRDGFMDSSSVIYLKGKHPDSIIVLRAVGIEKQLEFIKNQR